MFFREFRVTTTLLIILAIVTGLYGLGWLNDEIKKWRQSKKPQPIQTISGSNPAHPQQPQPIQFNNQAHNPEVVNRAMTANPVDTVTKLMTNGKELLSESDHPESNKSEMKNCNFEFSSKNWTFAQI